MSTTRCIYCGRYEYKMVLKECKSCNKEIKDLFSIMTKKDDVALKKLAERE